MSVVDGVIGKYMKINPHIHHIYIRINKKITTYNKKNTYKQWNIIYKFIKTSMENNV